jgi:hypothetical protein
MVKLGIRKLVHIVSFYGEVMCRKQIIHGAFVLIFYFKLMEVIICGFLFLLGSYYMLCDVKDNFVIMKSPLQIKKLALFIYSIEV